ncbi:hypothetical protein DUNSADRAFT_18177 [Dunaliella salina]|uniref:Uncharacterized protein n=1 Tax=Dunaliella salina TaxID=3046 RepID=A0ABQ7G0L9_DUNSA|nr:hypothetical protein DUNSADRAFT_18177 [Dunaliella salina]|eukprot:KAF5828125.1 hypothetical protein DUNSADRAFT_18177 [Dunaliella salina]
MRESATNRAVFRNFVPSLGQFSTGLLRNCVLLAEFFSHLLEMRLLRLWTRACSPNFKIPMMSLLLFRVWFFSIFLSRTLMRFDLFWGFAWGSSTVYKQARAFCSSLRAVLLREMLSSVDIYFL